MSIAELIKLKRPRLIACLQQILDFCLPENCILCGIYKPTLVNLCTYCLNDLPILADCCVRCAVYLNQGGEILFKSKTMLCGSCIKKPPPFDAAFSLFHYQGTASYLLRSLKFNQQIAHAKLLGFLLAEKILQIWYLANTLPDVILPVPLHHVRLQKRGYNQALEIAKPVAKLIGRPILLSGLIRHKDTLPQTGLVAEVRKQNLIDAFTTRQDFTGKTVALVDDVITTGCTVAACAKVLKANGATSVHVWSCARR